MLKKNKHAQQSLNKTRAERKTCQDFSAVHRPPTCRRRCRCHCCCLRVCSKEISLMLKLNERAVCRGDAWDDALWKQSDRISIHEFTLPLCVCARVCVCSVIHTHLSTFMSYFVRSFPVSSQVRPLCVSSLLCTSHTLITMNVLSPFYTVQHECVRVSLTLFFNLHTNAVDASSLSFTLYKLLSLSLSLGFVHLLCLSPSAWRLLTHQKRYFYLFNHTVSNFFQGVFVFVFSAVTGWRMTVETHHFFFLYVCLVGSMKSGVCLSLMMQNAFWLYKRGDTWIYSTTPMMLTSVQQ